MDENSKSYSTLNSKRLGQVLDFTNFNILNINECLNLLMI